MGIEILFPCERTQGYYLYEIKFSFFYFSNKSKVMDLILNNWTVTRSSELLKLALAT